MASRIVIIGGGIIGAAIAYALAEKGARHITVIEAGTLANQSSGRSFGWLNASFSIDAHHFTFRHDAMAAWRRFAQDKGSPHIRWTGGLVWEHTGDEMDMQATLLAERGYQVEEVDNKAFLKREPNISTPP